MPTDLFRKSIKGVRNPGLAARYLWSSVTDLPRELERRWIVHSSDSVFVRRGVQGSEMFLDATDLGISLDLARDGIREPVMTDVYQQSLAEFASGDGALTVVDVGANIGYYALMAVTTVDSDVSVLAIEPEPRNVDTLEMNVHLNEFEDSITIRNHAVGATERTAQLIVSDRSNLHAIDDDFGGESAIDVPVGTLDDVVAEEGYAPGEVDVVRMDVEGHEGAVFAGMQDILSADTPLLMNVEIHVPFLADAELRRILDWVRRDEVDVIHIDGKNTEIETIQQIRSGEWVHVIARRRAL